MATNNYIKITREVKRQIKISEYDNLDEHFGFVDEENVGENESEVAGIILDTFRDVVSSEKPLSLLIQGERLSEVSEAELSRKRVTKRLNFGVYRLPTGFVIMRRIYDNNHSSDEITISTKRPQFHVDSRGFIFVADEFQYGEYFMDYYYSPPVVVGDENVIGLNQLILDKAFLDLVAANVAYDIEKSKNKELANIIQADITRLSAKFSGQNATGANEVPYTDEDARFDRSGLSYAGGYGQSYGGLGSSRRFSGFNR